MSAFGLLEPCEVGIQRPSGKEDTMQGWRFLRNPHHWAASWIQRGDILVKVEAPSAHYADRRPTSWATSAFGGWLWGIPSRVAQGFLEADRLERAPEYRAALGALPDTDPGLDPPRAFLERDLPKLGLRRGDILVRVWGAGLPPHCRPFSRAELEFIRASFMADEGLLTSLNPYDPWDRVLEVIRDRQSWVTRPGPCMSVFRPSTLTTIHAASDEGAIFELVHASGCRMPHRTEKSQSS